MSHVSVVVPVYKVEKYIHNCVDSILSQTFQDFELILVDDGSPDSCPAICDEYATIDPRVVVIHKENGGVSSARNAGLDIAKGEYITFVDSDDWISNTFLENAVGMCKEKCLDIFMGGYQWISPTGEQRCICIPEIIDASQRSLSDEEQTLLLRNSYSSSVWGNFFLRKFIGQLHFQERMDFGEDLSFVFELLKRKPRCYAVPVPYYYYRNTENSLTKQCSKEKLLNVVQTYQVLLDFSEVTQNSSLLTYVQQRWIDDLLGLQKSILLSQLPIIKKYILLTTLLSDPQLRSIVRQSKDLYCIRYCTRPALLICYNTYLLLREKAGR